MSFTLRQVQPLLTKPELELFQASRATAIKTLTARQLATRITRARTLRDKYRDLYRRQTVATRSGPASQRGAQGSENARTEVKAEVMAEALARFEAQLAKVEARVAQAPAKKTAVKKTTVKKAGASQAITGAAQPVAKLVKQVRGAVKKQQAEPPVEGKPMARRGSRTQVGGSSSANAKGAVPTNMPARAQRVNPLKAEPVNKKIHASARSRQQAATAKRDAR